MPTPAEDTDAGIDLSGGATLIGFASDAGRIESELSASFDLFVEWSRGPGSLWIYIEGSSAARTDGVIATLPESNADAGTALDGDGDGRIQVSELKYSFALPGRSTVDAGLIDLTAYLDTTRINNDENMQFLGTSFLNNPAIAFPDYVPGFVYQRDPVESGAALVVACSASEGLADNPGATYEEVFELSAKGKGAFIGAEAGWQTDRQRYRLGAWVDTSTRSRVEPNRAGGDSHGVYATIGGSRGNHAANLRIGVAEEATSPVAAFASLTYQLDRGRQVVGLGVARNWSARRLSGAEAATTQLEAYLRGRVAPGLFLTPSIQIIHDSGLGLSGVPGDSTIAVFALRVRATF